jgi:hypothetical protein
MIKSLIARMRIEHLREKILKLYVGHYLRRTLSTTIGDMVFQFRCERNLKP